MTEKGKKGSDYWDRLFSYETSNDSYIASFPLQNIPSFKMRQSGDGMLAGFFQAFSGKQQGIYREEYIVYRMNTKTMVLIESHVYYANKKDYKNYFQRLQDENPYSIPYSQKPLEFIDREIPPGFVKFGRDKSFWQCHEVSYIKYLLHGFGRIFSQILGA